MAFRLGHSACRIGGRDRNGVRLPAELNRPFFHTLDDYSYCEYPNETRTFALIRVSATGMLTDIRREKCLNTTTTKQPSTTKKLRNRIGKQQKLMKRVSTQ